MNVFNIFLIFLMCVIVSALVIGGLYIAGDCTIVELMGGEITSECLDPVETTKCSNFDATQCPEGKELKPDKNCNPEKGCDVETCCGPPGSDDQPIEELDEVDEDWRYEDPSSHLNYVSCAHAIQHSRPDDAFYLGDCPWPLKTLTNQTGGDVLEHNSKRWILDSVAELGMTPGASNAHKEAILGKCCPAREIKLCRGPRIGAPGGYGAHDGSIQQGCRKVHASWPSDAGTQLQVAAQQTNSEVTAQAYIRYNDTHRPSTSSTRTATTAGGQEIPQTLSATEQNSLFYQCQRGPDLGGEDDWGGNAQRGRRLDNTWPGIYDSNSGSRWSDMNAGYCSIQHPSSTTFP